MTNALLHKELLCASWNAKLYSVAALAAQYLLLMNSFVWCVQTNKTSYFLYSSFQNTRETKGASIISLLWKNKRDKWQKRKTGFGYFCSFERSDYAFFWRLSTSMSKHNGATGENVSGAVQYVWMIGFCSHSSGRNGTVTGVKGELIPQSSKTRLFSTFVLDVKVQMARQPNL